MMMIMLFPFSIIVLLLVTRSPRRFRRGSPDVSVEERGLRVSGDPY
jgi:hypothetical protein